MQYVNWVFELAEFYFGLQDIGAVIIALPVCALLYWGFAAYKGLTRGY